MSLSKNEARIVELEEELATIKAERIAERIAEGKKLSRAEAMLETVPVGVVIADENGQIVHGNSTVEEMVRHPVLHSTDVDSYGEWISYHEDGRRVESHEYPLARVLRDREEVATLDVHYQRGDGSRFWMRIIGEPVLDVEGEVIGATVALVDIDEERRLREGQEVLIAELNHRVKNAFAVSQAIVSRLLRSYDAETDLAEAIDNRLKAYATAHAKLIGSEWSRVPLGEVAADVLEPISDGRISMSGPALVLPSRNALALSMAFYELATNASKYGSLSVPEGKVELTWGIDDETGEWFIDWLERGGPKPEYTKKSGFGSFITGRALMMETRGKTQSQFAEEGFEWSLTMPPASEVGESGK